MVAARRNKTHGWGPTTVDFVAGGTMMVLLRLGAAAGGTAFAALPDTEALLPALEAVLSGLGRQESNPLFGDEDAHGVVDRVAAARSAQVELSFQEQSLCAEAWDALRPLRWAEQARALTAAGGFEAPAGDDDAEVRAAPQCLRCPNQR